MIKHHKSGLAALLETRVHSSKMENILKMEKLTSFVAVEACGFAGGIWLRWDSSMVDIEVISKNNQTLNVLIKIENGWCWILTVVYASPNPIFRRELWLYLIQMGAIMTVPWITIGDFNQVIIVSNMWGGRGNYNPICLITRSGG